MINYNNGKIYKIEPNVEHEENEIYIGSTTKKYLCQRMAAHSYEYKNWKKNKRHNYSCFKLFDKYGFENCSITLLEIVNANSKDELEMRENQYIKIYSCDNKIIPLRTDKEDNREKILLYNKNYYEDNKEVFLEKIKVYRKTNFDKIKERKSKPFQCECGAVAQITIKQKHLRTKKHQNFINLNN